MTFRNLFICICLFTLGGLYSCQSVTKSDTEQKPNANPAAKETWECPMKCDAKKFTKAGKCPVCGMDLVVVSEG